MEKKWPKNLEEHRQVMDERKADLESFKAGGEERRKSQLERIEKQRKEKQELEDESKKEEEPAKEDGKEKEAESSSEEGSSTEPSSKSSSSSEDSSSEKEVGKEEEEEEQEAPSSSVAGAFGTLITVGKQLLRSIQNGMDKGIIHTIGEIVSLISTAHAEAGCEVDDCEEMVVQEGRPES